MTGEETPLSPPEDEMVEGDRENGCVEDGTEDLERGEDGRNKDITEAGVVGDEKLRWCKFCKMTQPLRSKHCLECRQCTAKYDHHCFWIGTCVGERNHGMFLIFLFFQSWEAVWAQHLVYTGFESNNKYDRSWKTWYDHNMFVMPVYVLLFCFMWFPLGLLAYHTVLAATNQTTWEAFRAGNISYLKKIPRTVLPFDRGIVGNCNPSLPLLSPP